MKTIFRKSFCLVFIFISTLASAKTSTPPLGSAERKAIMDALRAPVESQIKKPVLFKVNHLKLESGWAFLIAEPLQPNGKAMDYHGTRYQKAVEADMFSNEVCALLREQNGAWKVIEFVMGPTDVVFYNWDKKYQAPAAIFKMER